MDELEQYEVTSPGEGAAGDGDRLRLEDVRRRSEGFKQELAREYYESTAGLKPESNVSALYRKHADLFSRDLVGYTRKKLAEAEARRAESPSAAEEARRLAYLLEFQTEEFIGSEVKSIIDEILTREASATARVPAAGAGAAGAAAGAGPTGGGAATTGSEQEIPFRSLHVEIANEKDRVRRSLLEAAQLRVVDELTPLFAERFGIERGIARSFGYPTYTALWQAVAGIDLAGLDRTMQAFLARTEDMYREAMGWVVRKRLGLDLADARKHDVNWIFRGEELDDYFPGGEEVLKTARRFLGDMGVDIAAGGNIRFDLERRERKSSRAFCATIRIPQEIVLCMRPEGGRRDWQGFLHELGHALHYGHTSPLEAFELRCLGDASLTETYAFLFQYLTLDKAWLKRCLNVAKPKEYLFLSYLEKLYFLRRYAAKLHYELALHGGDAGDGIEGKDAVYEANMVGAVKVRYPRELFLYDVDRGYYAARYLRAWLFEALLSKHLVHYFDEDWYRNPRTGAFLKRQWALGQRFRVDEMAREIGYEGLSAAALEEELFKNL